MGSKRKIVSREVKYDQKCIITRRSNITRVLRTSKGVVIAAATAPAALPHAAASYE